MVKLRNAIKAVGLHEERGGQSRAKRILRLGSPYEAAGRFTRESVECHHGTRRLCNQHNWRNSMCDGTSSLCSPSSFNDWHSAGASFLSKAAQHGFLRAGSAHSAMEIAREGTQRHMWPLMPAWVAHLPGTVRKPAGEA